MPHLRAAQRGLTLLVAVTLVGCAAPPQAPADYMTNALDWVESHSVFGERVADWPALRAEAMARVSEPASTADTYPALYHVLQALQAAGDLNASLLEPDNRVGRDEGQLTHGFMALERDGTIIVVDQGGPAEAAGLQVGDRISTMNDAPYAPIRADGTPFPRTLRLTVERAGEAAPREVTLEAVKLPYEGRPGGRRIDGGDAGVGYLELPWDWGSQAYPTLAQGVIRSADQPPACGWIVDLRRNTGGNMWTFLAAVGPILGSGELGGFLYRDGHREGWSYEEGEVRWNGERRDESAVEGPIYEMAPRPVALLTSPATVQAGETLLVAFKGRPATRLFGEPTQGLPVLTDHTTLSDEAEIFVSGAFSYDRDGTLYDGPLAPDEAVATDWSRFGSDDDPVIQAALAWLRAQPACGG